MEKAIAQGRPSRRSASGSDGAFHERRPWVQMRSASSVYECRYESCIPARHASVTQMSSAPEYPRRLGSLPRTPGQMDSVMTSASLSASASSALDPAQSPAVLVQKVAGSETRLVVLIATMHGKEAVLGPSGDRPSRPTSRRNDAAGPGFENWFAGRHAARGRLWL